MGGSTGGRSSGAGGGGVAGVGTNRGTQKDQGKRQVSLGSSLSRRTRTLHRPQGVGGVILTRRRVWRQPFRLCVGRRA